MEYKMLHSVSLKFFQEEIDAMRKIETLLSNVNDYISDDYKPDKYVAGDYKNTYVDIRFRCRGEITHGELPKLKEVEVDGK